MDLETDAGERFAGAEVLVRSCVTKSCRKTTSAAQLAAGSNTTEERHENERCRSSVMFLFTTVCSGITSTPSVVTVSAQLVSAWF